MGFGDCIGESSRGRIYRYSTDMNMSNIAFSILRRTGAVSDSDNYPVGDHMGSRKDLADVSQQFTWWSGNLVRTL